GHGRGPIAGGTLLPTSARTAAKNERGPGPRTRGAVRCDLRHAPSSAPARRRLRGRGRAPNRRHHPRAGVVSDPAAAYLRANDHPNATRGAGRRERPRLSPIALRTRAPTHQVLECDEPLASLFVLPSWPSDSPPP